MFEFEKRWGLKVEGKIEWCKRNLGQANNT